MSHEECVYVCVCKPEAMKRLSYFCRCIAWPDRKLDRQWWRENRLFWKVSNVRLWCLCKARQFSTRLWLPTVNLVLNSPRSRKQKTRFPSLSLPDLHPLYCIMFVFIQQNWNRGEHQQVFLIASQNSSWWLSQLSTQEQTQRLAFMWWWIAKSPSICVCVRRTSF